MKVGSKTNAAFDNQKKKGLISCPVCDDKNIEKIPSAFAIKKPSAEKKPAMDERRALMQLGREISRYVEQNFDNVGCDFAKEALKIHYGASEPRNIRGTSTSEEEKQLKDEGIEFFKVPPPAATGFRNGILKPGSLVLSWRLKGLKKNTVKTNHGGCAFIIRIHPR